MVNFLTENNAVHKVFSSTVGVAMPAGLNETYKFVSYADSQASVEYAQGSASLTGIVTQSYLQIIVETNSVDGFVGNRYWLSKEAQAGDNNIWELYLDGEGQTSAEIFVKIEPYYTEQ